MKTISSNQGEFTFEEEDHSYSLNDKIIPSVSDMLRPIDDVAYAKIPRKILEKAGRFGNAVHKMAELHLLGKLDIDKLDESLLPSLNALKQWIEDNGLANLINIEIPLCSKRLGYAGTPDLVFEDKIIDIKSRYCQSWRDSIQIAAYAKLCDINGIGDKNKKHYVLFLKQHGGYVYKPLKNKQAWAEFKVLKDYYDSKKMVESLINHCIF